MFSPFKEAALSIACHKQAVHAFLFSATLMVFCRYITFNSPKQYRWRKVKKYFNAGKVFFNEVTNVSFCNT